MLISDVMHLFSLSDLVVNLFVDKTSRTMLVLQVELDQENSLRRVAALMIWENLQPELCA